MADVGELGLLELQFGDILGAEPGVARPDTAFELHVGKELEL